MKTMNHRLIVCPKDVMCIKGLGYKAARLYLKKAKEYFHKKPHQEISVGEFSRFSGIPIEEIQAHIQALS